MRVGVRGAGVGGLGVVCVGSVLLIVGAGLLTGGGAGGVGAGAGTGTGAGGGGAGTETVIVPDPFMQPVFGHVP